jgi:hypothetical protein
MTNPDPARFSSEEFALVLRKAAELQDRRRSAPGHVVSDGITLAEMQQIAREVGLDPALIAEAASLVRRPRADQPGFFRLRSEFFAERTLEGAVAPGQLGEVVHLIRDEIGKPGQVQQVLDGVEWSYNEANGSIHVTVRPREGRTRVEVMADRENEEAVIVGIPTFAGLLISILAPMSMGVDPQSIALGVGIAGGAHALARAAWMAVSRGWQRRISEVAERVAEGIAAIRATAQQADAPESGSEEASPRPQPSPGATADADASSPADLRSRWSAGR